MRLLYLDEAGTDRVNAPALCVAGVMVHGDNEYPEVERRIAELVEKYVPEEDRYGFAFHATDIFHGSRYFDRRKPEWADRERRAQVLLELAQIIDDLSLPVMVGRYFKKNFPDGGKPQEKDLAIHSTAAFDCLVHADRWLARFAPTELARVTHEDGTPAKAMIKGSLRALRDPAFAKGGYLDKDLMAEFNLPLKRIVDSVSFEDKASARPLQLADLCAFITGRMAKGASVPEPVVDIIVRHAQWTLQLAKEARERASSLKEGPPA